MNHLLNTQHTLVQKTLRDFTKNEVKPLAKVIDESERFPRETVEKMAKMNLLGLPFDTKYNGSGGDTISYAIAVMELSKACATTGVILSAHVSLCAAPIEMFGSEAQKAMYLPNLLSGKTLGAFGLTEPNAGTDAGAQKTTAKAYDDHFLLNGNKIFITNAGEADVYIISALTTPEAKHKGISLFIVEANSEGFSVGKKEMKLGIRGSSTRELILDNVKVPKENLLGQRDKGFSMIMEILSGGRIGIAAQAVGIAEGAIEEALHYTKQRKQFGNPIIAFQNTQFTLAEMETKKEAAKQLLFKAALYKDQGRPYAKEAAMAKLYAGTIATEITQQAVQLFGGYGYTREYDVERMMRDAKITEIYEGTNEAQKMVIANMMIKEARQ